MKKNRHFSQVQFCHGPKLVKGINNNCGRKINLSRTGDKCLIGETVQDSNLQLCLEKIMQLVLFFFLFVFNILVVSVSQFKKTFLAYLQCARHSVECLGY